MKTILKTLLGIIIIALCIFTFLIIYATVTDYAPEPTTPLFETETYDTLNDSIELNLFVWNIGYCGLSEDMDFFYDGGKMVRTSRENVMDNVKSITNFILKNDSIDIYLLQEVDKKSRRSYKTNQVDIIERALGTYTLFFGKNYDVFFVPVPPTNPLGTVESGLATYSRFVPYQSVRHSFPGNYGWPKGLFMLDRCFLVNRYKLNNGKELLVINTHNSAYDDGSLRKGQMQYLKDFLLDEYEKGNYIIVGGDWNQSPYDLEVQYNNPFDTINHAIIDKDYLPADWTWLYDDKVPTNRRLLKPYDEVTSLTTVIDFYLLSPNVEGMEVKNIDLNFENSDHQPIIAKIKLK